jgi:hypothetical protein
MSTEVHRILFTCGRSRGISSQSKLKPPVLAPLLVAATGPATPTPSPPPGHPHRHPANARRSPRPSILTATQSATWTRHVGHPHHHPTIAHRPPQPTQGARRPPPGRHHHPTLPSSVVPCSPPTSPLASTLVPLLTPLLCLEPALVVSALLVATVIVPASECRVILVAQAEAVAPIAAPSCSGAEEESAAPTTPTLSVSSCRPERRPLPPLPALPYHPSMFEKFALTSSLLDMDCGLWCSVFSLVIIG